MKIIHFTKIALFSSALFVAASAANAWTGPAGNPPYCPPGYTGCDAPLNVGGVSQTKAGPLWANSLGTWGGIFVQNFVDFGQVTGEKLDFYGPGYGVGIQPSTLYLRTAGSVSIYKGGTYSNSANNPGGGTILMQVGGSDDKTYVNDVCIFGGGKCLSTVGGNGGGVSAGPGLIGAGTEVQVGSGKLISLSGSTSSNGDGSASAGYIANGAFALVGNGHALNGVLTSSYQCTAGNEVCVKVVSGNVYVKTGPTTLLTYVIQ